MDERMFPFNLVSVVLKLNRLTETIAQDEASHVGNQAQARLSARLNRIHRGKHGVDF